MVRIKFFNTEIRSPRENSEEANKLLSSLEYKLKKDFNVQKVEGPDFDLLGRYDLHVEIPKYPSGLCVVESNICRYPFIFRGLYLPIDIFSSEHLMEFYILESEERKDFELKFPWIGGIRQVANIRERYKGSRFNEKAEILIARTLNFLKEKYLKE